MTSTIKARNMQMKGFVWIGLMGLMVLSLVALPECNEYRVLEGQQLRVAVDVDVTSPKFGSVSAFKGAAANFFSENWFIPKMGKVMASNRKLVSASQDTVIVRHSDFAGSPLNVEMSYFLSDSALVMVSKFWADVDMSFPAGLDFGVRVTANELFAENHSNEGVSYSLSNSKVSYAQNKTFLTFSGKSGTTTFFIRNPFHSFWTFNANGKGEHLLHVLPTLSCPGPEGGVGSKLSSGDTITRRVEVYPGDFVSSPIYFSEHPDGFFNSITMYWDELPRRENWAFMTTGEAKDVRYDHYFVKLLSEHPRMKMGYLLMLDRMFYRDTSGFEGWKTSSPYIIPDSLDEKEGVFCANVFSPIAGDYNLWQTVKVKPNSSYFLEYQVKTEGLEGVGAYAEIFGASGKSLMQDQAVNHDQEWLQKVLPLQTGSDTLVRVNLHIVNGKGSAFFDGVNLYNTSGEPNLMVNGGFELNTPEIIFDNRRRRWSDAHGRQWILGRAPIAYREFLKRIENHEMKYGWEQRVNLGCHGYHHTPSLLEAEPNHEFVRYDLEGDSLVLDQIFSETIKIGLTKKSLRYLRSPGHEYSASLVNRLVDSGFVFFGASMMNNQNSNFFLQRGKKRMWVNGFTYWADLKPGVDLGGVFLKALKQGHLGHIGGHPEAIFPGEGEEAFQALNKFFTELESTYDNLGYVFPDEFADNANSIYDLEMDGVAHINGGIRFQYKGETRAGNTIVYNGTCYSVLLDGKPITVRISGGRTYMIMPQAGPGSHLLELQHPLAKMSRKTLSLAAEKLGTQLIKSHGQRHASIVFHLDKPAKMQINLFDMSGRSFFEKAKNMKAGSNEFSLDLPRTSVKSATLRLMLNDKIVYANQMDL